MVRIMYDKKRTARISARIPSSVDKILIDVMEEFSITKSDALTYVATYYDSTTTINAMVEHFKYLKEERLI